MWLGAVSALLSNRDTGRITPSLSNPSTFSDFGPKLIMERNYNKNNA